MKRAEVPEIDGEAGGSGSHRPLSRTAIGVGILLVIAGLAWTTMEAGNMRTLVMVVLGGFAIRLLLLSRGSRYDKTEKPEV